ncbi:hypothetical protein SAMN05877753_11186 [Bacillus oleivorans]|uniref:Uncharacterized protein n=1 Tax=Bacillus oleivorans TaxID=1448271 RepID=A0A285D797_9BACI|nr:hypothetical protein [Bacillus oleivorans]SNX75226.1 hypothetical protein SAMN05877753_11186 [Bacillus oleivorans]
MYWAFYLIIGLSRRYMGGDWNLEEGTRAFERVDSIWSGDQVFVPVSAQLGARSLILSRIFFLYSNCSGIING